jgi:hypothetical protein
MSRRLPIIKTIIFDLGGVLLKKKMVEVKENHDRT